MYLTYRTYVEYRLEKIAIMVIVAIMMVINDHPISGNGHNGHDDGHYYGHHYGLYDGPYGHYGHHGHFWALQVAADGSATSFEMHTLERQR